MSSTHHVPEAACHSTQALRTIAGERKATEFLARLHAQQAQPDELAVLVSMLYGGELRGFARVLVKALERSDPR